VRRDKRHAWKSQELLHWSVECLHHEIVDF